jgi:serine/threonine-protein kinase
MSLQRPLTPALESSIGKPWGRYRVERLLARGGMSEVYVATHLDLDRQVALKILKLPLVEKRELVVRMLREGQTVGRLRHPHVVSVLDVGEEQGVPYLVMELLDGEDLAAHLLRAGPLSPAAAVDLLLPVLSAVEEVHRHGIVHRDIKPQNIFLCRAGRGWSPKLLDFGIARVTEAVTGGDLAQTEHLAGTPFYMSPEQISTPAEVDGRADQYALGVALYECVTGARPFAQTDLYPLLHAIVEGRPPPPRARHPDIPPAFEAVVLRAMNRHRDRRFASVRAMARALLPFASAPVAATWAPIFQAQPADTPVTSFIEERVTGGELDGSWPTTATLDPLPPRKALGLVRGARAAAGLALAFSLGALSLGALTRDRGPKSLLPQGSPQRAPAAFLSAIPSPSSGAPDSAAGVPGPDGAASAPAALALGLPSPPTGKVAGGAGAPMRADPPAPSGGGPDATTAAHPVAGPARAGRSAQVSQGAPGPAPAGAPLAPRGANGAPILD